jgi:predicted nuclease of predicted toxin-antitoxin system
MHLLVDECLTVEFVDEFRQAGHDVIWVREHCPGANDDVLLAFSFSQNRILISEDRDFGELVFRRRLPAIGIVLVKLADFEGSLRQTASYAADKIAQLGSSLIGHLTVIEPERERQRQLPGDPL